MRKTRSERPIEVIQKRRRLKAGETIEEQENQIIAMAYNLVKRRIEKGTATSQEVIHFLKTGSVLGRLEIVKSEQENLLLQAKTDALKSQKKVEELYANAMTAFRTYNGQGTPDESE